MKAERFSFHVGVDEIVKPVRARYVRNGSVPIRAWATISAAKSTAIRRSPVGCESGTNALVRRDRQMPLAHVVTVFAECLDQASRRAVKTRANAPGRKSGRGPRRDVGARIVPRRWRHRAQRRIGLQRHRSPRAACRAAVALQRVESRVHECRDEHQAAVWIWMTRSTESASGPIGACLGLGARVVDRRRGRRTCRNSGSGVGGGRTAWLHGAPVWPTRRVRHDRGIQARVRAAAGARGAAWSRGAARGTFGGFSSAAQCPDGGKGRNQERGAGHLHTLSKRRKKSALRNAAK
jgi:hypothetical protein